eukprot:g20975.t1
MNIFQCAVDARPFNKFTEEIDRFLISNGLKHFEEQEESGVEADEFSHDRIIWWSRLKNGSAVDPEWGKEINRRNKLAAKDDYINILDCNANECPTN